MLTLEPYQEEGVAFLSARRHALLADEMRLGKTPQSIVAADNVMARTVVVVTVAVGVFNWQRQFEQWSVFDRRITVVSEGGAATPQDGVIIMSFDMVKKHGDRLPPVDLLIVDESHFVKSIDAERTKAVLGRSGIIHKAKRTWFLTGTPAPNGDPRELWSILFTCGRTRLTFDEFQSRFCQGWKGAYGFNFTGLKNEPELRAMLSGFMLRRRWRDVMAQLPKLTFETLVVPPGAVDIEVYFFDRWVVDRGQAMLREIEEEKALTQNLLDAAFGLKKQTVARLGGLEHMAPALVTMRRYTALQKCPAIVDIVSRELDRGEYEKLVIFAVHRDTIEFLRQAFRKYRPVTLYGGTSLQARKANLDKFHNNPKCRIFLGQIIAAGTNVDLSCASDILLMEQSFVPGENAQAIMRCHNIKQSKAVHVRVATLANDIDERVQEVLRRKTRDICLLYDEQADQDG